MSRFEPVLDGLLDLVANISELLKLFFFGTFARGRIFERPAECLQDVRPDSRARFFCLVAYEDDVPRGNLPEIFAHRLGTMSVEVVTNLFHDLNGQGIDTSWFESGTVGFKAVTSLFPQKGLGHLAAS